MDYSKFRDLQVASRINMGLVAFGIVVVLAYLMVLNGRFATNEDQIKALNAELSAKNAQIADLQAASSLSNITIQNRAVKLDGIRSRRGRQIYDFSIWLEIPPSLKYKIEKVIYHFPQNSFLYNIRESKAHAHNYAVGYRDWGCFQELHVDVYLSDGAIHNMVFDQCTDSTLITYNR